MLPGHAVDSAYLLPTATQNTAGGAVTRASARQDTVMSESEGRQVKHVAGGSCQAAGAVLMPGNQ